MHNFNLADRLPTSLSCEPQNTSQQDSVYPFPICYAWPNPWTPGWEPPN